MVIRAEDLSPICLLAWVVNLSFLPPSFFSPFKVFLFLRKKCEACWECRLALHLTRCICWPAHTHKKGNSFLKGEGVVSVPQSRLFQWKATWFIYKTYFPFWWVVTVLNSSARRVKGGEVRKGDGKERQRWKEEKGEEKRGSEKDRSDIWAIFSWTWMQISSGSWAVWKQTVWTVTLPGTSCEVAVVTEFSDTVRVWTTLPAPGRGALPLSRALEASKAHAVDSDLRLRKL